jgi:hypothetical protein
MPTIASSNVPTPKSWDEFEDITLSAARLRWDSSEFYRHGRSGQKQDGVDIYGHDDDENLVGIQCKNTIDHITLNSIKSEIENAEKFTPGLNRLYIATTARRDVHLQKAIRDIDRQRRKQGKFKVGILFWDDICHDLAKDDKIFFQHYPQFRNNADSAKEHDRRLFDELTMLLSSDGVIGFLDRTNMAGWSFPHAELHPLHKFNYYWNQPEREFITPELEALRAALWKKVDSYLHIIAFETFPTHNSGYQSVPDEWEFEQPERFWRVVDALHNLAGEIVLLHAELVRTGRARLIGAGT